MQDTVRIGLIGLGRQMRRHHIPYLQRRMEELKDIEIAWISSYLPEDALYTEPYRDKYRCEPGNAWETLLRRDIVDAVIVSLPNLLHGDPVRKALTHGVNVAVEKPPTIGSTECEELVMTAEMSNLILVTISQRRYEAPYQVARDIIAGGELGEPQLISYMIAHEYFTGDIAGSREWTKSKRMAGGGVLLASGYHGIDTVLWMLNYQAPLSAFRAISVSARSILDPRENRPFDDRIEVISNVRVLFDNGCIFDVIASFANPSGSRDESYKIYGSAGAIRISRDRYERGLSNSTSVSYQNAKGVGRQYNDSSWIDKDWAPIDDLINAIQKKRPGIPWRVLSPTVDSLGTLRIIEAAYESTNQNGKEIALKR